MSHSPFETHVRAYARAHELLWKMRHGLSCASWARLALVLTGKVSGPSEWDHPGAGTRQSSKHERLSLGQVRPLVLAALPDALGRVSPQTGAGLPTKGRQRPSLTRLETMPRTSPRAMSKSQTLGFPIG
jgi:hypothetical protein